MSAGHDTLSGIQSALSLEQIAGCDIFIGHEERTRRAQPSTDRSFFEGGGREHLEHFDFQSMLYGGTVLAQALESAQRTLPDGFAAHSLHGYFLLAGETGKKLLFEVDRIRDGKSFATRLVKAIQSNKAIFQMSVSFMRPEPGPEFQTPAGTIRAVLQARGLNESLPAPEELLAQGARPQRATIVDLSGGTESLFLAEGDWWNLRWCRHKTALPAGSAHRSIFAWMSNALLVDMAMRPHLQKHGIKMGFSLDHTVHFHHHFRVDEWLLFHTRTTVSAEARALVWVEVFSQKGLLVATATQEALIRLQPLALEDVGRALPPHPPPGRPLQEPSPLQLALGLEQIADCDIFTGTEEAIGQTSWGRVYGGHVFAQSLMAAQRTVPEGFYPHSVHGYFILAGTSGVKLLFDVDRVRDGKSFITRVVKAQQSNRAIFEMSVSFTRREWGPAFRTPGREIAAQVRSRGLSGETFPTPEELLAKGQLPTVAAGADNRGATEALLIAEGDWWQIVWCRHRAPLPDDMHESILAWMSDRAMVTITRKPHKDQQFKMSMSLDHAIRFHQPFRADEWLLFNTRTSVSAAARGFARHEVFSRNGDLVATVIQEALIRPFASPGVSARL